MDEKLKAIVSTPSDDIAEFVFEKNEVHHEFPEGMDYKCERECNETEYWLELLYETDSITKVEFDGFQKRCIELRRMLVSSVTTLKQKN